MIFGLIYTNWLVIKGIEKRWWNEAKHGLVWVVGLFWGRETLVGCDLYAAVDIQDNISKTSIMY